MHAVLNLPSVVRATVALITVAFAVSHPRHSVAAEIASGAKSAQPRQPQAAVDADGTIHVVYGVGDEILHCRSSDHGKTFSRPHELPRLGVLALGMRRGPRIAVFNGQISVTAIAGPIGKGRDGDVLCCRSADGGQTWQGAVRVNDVEDSAREGLHGLAAGADGTLCCVWLDLRHGTTEVLASTSRDGGATWSKNVLVYHSPDGSVCECCHPSVAIGADRKIHVLWRNALDGNRDMYVASSDNGGAIFGDASKLGAGSWQLQACPMDGGAVAALADGAIASVWRRDDTVFVQHGDILAEESLGQGEQPWLAAAENELYVIWLRRRGGPAYWRATQDRAIRQLAEVASDAVVAASASGQGPVVALWESRDQDRYTIMCEVLNARRDSADE